MSFSLCMWGALKVGKVSEPNQDDSLRSDWKYYSADICQRDG